MAALLAVPARAGDCNLSVDLQFHNQVLQFDFTLTANILPLINASHFPDMVGRAAFFDHTEFLKIGLAKPVPEPATYERLLAGLGLLGAAVLRQAAPTSDHDHAWPWWLGVQRLHQRIAPLQRGALVDVALVGDLAGVDGRRLGHHQRPGDAAR